MSLLSAPPVGSHAAYWQLIPTKWNLEVLLNSSTVWVISVGDQGDNLTSDVPTSCTRPPASRKLQIWKFIVSTSSECPPLSESPSCPPVHLQQFPVTRRDGSDGSALGVRVSTGYRAVQSSRTSHVDYFGPWDDQISLDWLLRSDVSWLQSALAPCTWWPSSLDEPSRPWV